MRNRRITSYHRQDKKGQTIDMNESTLIPYEGTGEDTIRDIQSVFEQHNKEASQARRGRIIKVPKIKVIKDYDAQ